MDDESVSITIERIEVETGGTAESGILRKVRTEKRIMPDVLKREVTPKIIELYRFYNIALRRDPGLNGTALFDITIMPDGTIGKVSSKVINLDGNFRDKCHELIRAWRFREIGETFNVRFPVRFALKRDDKINFFLIRQQ